MTPIRKLEDSRSNGASANEVRSRYLAFFRARGHAIIPSAPIVPENDPTTLFTSSGMQPLVPYLLGEPHPKGSRLVNSQMSFRAGDIEEVGDNRHTTFFEMLGNWSLGDYFKKEQLPWVYEFLTEELKLPKERLWITCFAGDESLGLPKDTESAEIWKKIGVPEDRVLFYDAKKNWWSRSGTPEKMPAGEPGGPDSEIFFDFQTPHNKAFGEGCHPNCDCGRFMEIGNSVFMEYIKQADGFGKLPKQNVDFGGGLERLTAATRDNPDVFKIDIFNRVILELEKQSRKSYDDLNYQKSFRIIADHIRAAVFIMAGGVRPSKAEQGYVLRRLLREAFIHTRILESFEGSIASLVYIFAEEYKNQYPHIQEKQESIRFDMLEEIKRIWKIEDEADLILGKKFDEFMKKIGKSGMKAQVRKIGKLEPYEVSQPFVRPDEAFQLYSTYGIPREKIITFIKSKNYILDLTEFNKLFDQKKKEHQATSRAGAAQKFAGGLADHAEQTVRYHTAHHILLKALQMVLGPEVHQRGSNITSERLRIDFSYAQKMTPEQKAEVERIVNEKIAESIPVIRTDMKKDDAEKLGAEHEFGANYPDIVSVYSVGPLPAGRQGSKPFSIEFCGGPHVSNTSELGAGGKKFKIQKEEASSAGIRRIKAVLE